LGLIKFIKPTWFRTNFKGTGLRTDFKATGLRNDFKATGLRNDFKATGLRSRLQSEDGSISVLVFGLFVVVLLSGVVLTDISAILVAQRSLVQATESAAQSAAHALDLETYYQGKHSALSFLVSDASPIIPIDCGAASIRASETLADVANSTNRNYGGSSKQLIRRDLSDVRISKFQCNGTEVLITASAKVWLPISLSLFSFESVELSASAGTTSVKKRVLSIFGIDF
jgi:hypothetical protein